jgi:sarcosine oxidase subunit alpha
VLKEEEFVQIEARKVIVATGATEKMLAFPSNDLPGIYGAGAVQTLMNVYGVRPGRRVLMVGSGNIGLIVSYQLLQAGVEVAAVVEAVPSIGGYWVHAAKIKRCGVEILVSHSIKEAIGEQWVEGAVIVKLDEDWTCIPGTERQIDCDTICLAVGLSPLSEVLHQSGCQLTYLPQLGGWVAVHDSNMETTQEGIYVAGDASGIEEACTAMLEGRIAGSHAALSLHPSAKDEANRIAEEAHLELTAFRAGPFGEMARTGKERMSRYVQ